MRKRCVSRQQELLAVGNVASVFPPRHFLRVGVKVGPGDMMVPPDLPTAQAGEEAFRHVRVGVGVGVLDGVIDSLGEETGLKSAPTGGLIA